MIAPLFRSACQLTGDIATSPVAELEALFSDDVPCGGVHDAECSGGRPAALKGFDHPSCTDNTVFFKCIACWQVWYRECMAMLAKQSGLVCVQCNQEFPSVEAFNDYRPF